MSVYSCRLSQNSHQLVAFFKMAMKINNCPRIKLNSSGIWRCDLGRVVYVMVRYLIAFFFRVILNCFTLKMKALRCFETTGNSPPETRRHISGGFSFRQLPFNIFSFAILKKTSRRGSHFICLWKLDFWVNSLNVFRGIQWAEVAQSV